MQWIAAVFALLLCNFCFAEQPQYDVLIRGAKIVDGSGAPSFTGDIAISGGKIAVAGNLGGSSASLLIDANGMVAAPGFIDIHTHTRYGIFEDPTAANYIRQGVTTVIEGQDGSSPLPLGSFLNRLSRMPISVNFGMLVGQGSIREAVIGRADRKATGPEIQRMKEMAAQAMRDGAYGLSTGLFYVPGAYTPTNEIIELAKTAGQLGGIHMSHMRDEAAGVLDSVRETIRIGEEGGLPTQVTHHKIVGTVNWGKSAETLRLVDQARARGVDVSIDQYPYTASSTVTSALVPQWALAGSRRAFLARLANPRQRAKIREGVIDRIQNDRGGGDPKNVVFADCPFDRSLNGRTLAQATERGGKPATFGNAADMLLQLEERGGCQAVFHAISEDDVERILRSPYTMIASDGEIPIPGQGVPHPRSYGTFARVLGRYVRERKALTLEEAVRKMTSMPAAQLGLHDRGILKPGMQADVVVFDPATVTDKATFLDPHQYAEGFRHVLVNGRPVILGGRITEERPGQVLRGPAYRP